jgi:hypothetical protein
VGGFQYREGGYRQVQRFPHNNQLPGNRHVELILRYVHMSAWGTRWRSGWGTMLQAGRWRDRVPMRWIFNWPNPSSRTMYLGSTQRLTEMSTRNILRG